MRFVVMLLMTDVATLSGCTESGTETPPEPSENVLGGVERLSAPRALDASGINKTVEFSGTYQVYENRQTTGRFSNELGFDMGHIKEFVLEDAPIDIPVRILIDVDAGVDGGDIDIWLGGFAMYWTYKCNCPFGGRSSIDTILIRDGSEPLVLYLQYDELDHQASFDFVLTVHLQADPALWPAAVPVAVPLDSPVQEIIMPNATAPVLVYGPAGDCITILTEQPARFLLEDQKPGTYTFWQQPGGTPSPVILLTELDAARPAPTIPKITYEMGPEWTVSSGTANEWSEATLRTPAQVGICMRGETGELNPQFSLTGPNGTLLSWTWDTTDEPLTATVFNTCRYTARADERQAPGTYTAQFEDDAGTVATLFIIFGYLT